MPSADLLLCIHSDCTCIHNTNDIIIGTCIELTRGLMIVSDDYIWGFIYSSGDFYSRSQYMHIYDVQSNTQSSILHI